MVGDPKRITGNGSVTGIELKRCTRVFDEQKRFSPAFDENDLATLEADQIIVAIGQMVDEQLAGHIPVEKRTRLLQDRPDYRANLRRRRVCRRRQCVRPGVGD